MNKESDNLKPLRWIDQRRKKDQANDGCHDAEQPRLGRLSLAQRASLCERTFAAQVASP